MKILVTGANGQLGRCIADEVNFRSREDMEYIFCDREELDITQMDNIKRVLDVANPDVIINCAAYTKTDMAEEKDCLRAYEVNTLGPTFLATICKERNISLIHISTDYVFDGQKTSVYFEEDECNPLNIYGTSKYCGEQAIRAINPSAIIVRTSWLYSQYGENFLTKTLTHLGNASLENRRLRYVQDQIGSPTYAANLAFFLVQRLVVRIDELKKGEGVINHTIYHYTDNGVASRYDFARAIEELVFSPDSFEELDVELDKSIIDACESNSFEYKTKRPQYCVLSKKNIIDDFGTDALRDWKESLKICSIHFPHPETIKEK